MKATIKDVADRSGVSIATVSRVINGASVVSEKSRNKVLKAIEELDFKPNQTARNLVMQKNTTIGIIVPALGNQFYGGILNGIEDASSELGYESCCAPPAATAKRKCAISRALRNGIAPASSS